MELKPASSCERYVCQYPCHAKILFKILFAPLYGSPWWQMFNIYHPVMQPEVDVHAMSDC